MLYRVYRPREDMRGEEDVEETGYRRREMESGRRRKQEGNMRKVDTENGEEMETKWNRLEVVPFLSLMNLPR